MTHKNLLKFSLLFISTMTLLLGCASRYEVREDYSDVVEDSEQLNSSKKTTIFFLVDGLSIPVLNAQLQKKHLPNIKKHFLGHGRKMLMAHSVFPSLTFPNIASLLREQPVNQTGAVGNNLIYQGRLIRFEEPAERVFFSHAMKGTNVFTRLQEKNYRTVSLDYGLGVDAGVRSEFDVKQAVAAKFHNYEYIDKKKIDSINILLKSKSTELWPEFIFVHLVGLDFISHDEGSRSEEAIEYLQELDENLEDLLETLREGESQGHKVISVMSADHGFASKVQKRLPIENVVARLQQDIRVLNEGRMAALFLPQDKSPQTLSAIASHLLSNSGIETVSFQTQGNVTIVSRKERMHLQYLKVLNCSNQSAAISVNGSAAFCPEQIPRSLQSAFYPFFVKNLAYYFQAHNAPDMVVIPSIDTTFYSTGKGFHGGPTVEETVIPLLMRNASLQNPNEIPAIWQLLQFL